MAGRIKHIETRIVTTFGVEDEEGNIVHMYVAQAEQNNPDDPLLFRRLHAESFEKALQGLQECRDKLEKRHAQE